MNDDTRERRPATHRDGGLPRRCRTRGADFRLMLLRKMSLDRSPAEFGAVLTPGKLPGRARRRYPGFHDDHGGCCARARRNQGGRPPCRQRGTATMPGRARRDAKFRRGRCSRVPSWTPGTWKSASATGGNFGGEPDRRWGGQLRGQLRGQLSPLPATFQLPTRMRVGFSTPRLTTQPRAARCQGQT
jgi:hypothetical protein